LFLIFLIPFGSCVAQSTFKVRFAPVYQGKEISLEQPLKDSSGNAIEFTTLRFYVSQLWYSDDQGQELTGEAYKLIDLEDPESLYIIEHTYGLTQIGFLLGIDSSTNVSGILEGPLDPINGMYWTWNSGYINFKLEGRSDLSSTPGKIIEYHLGGYLPPYPTSRHLTFQLNPEKSDVVIEIHLDQWLNNVNMAETPSVMIPGEKAVKLTDQLVNVFQIR
jgi:hypothetical protein